jgi:hypothetical protein
MKYFSTLIIVIAVIVLGLLTFADTTSQESLGAISRSVTNASSSITSSTGVQVLSPNSRANYRRIQQDTAATVYCVEGVSSTAKLASGIRLTQGQEYVWSSKEGNLWPGAVSCIANSTTSVVMTKEAFE